MQVPIFILGKTPNKIINCRQEVRKSLDSLNTIIYEPIHSDDTVICVAIMRVIIIVNEKGFYLEFMQINHLLVKEAKWPYRWNTTLGDTQWLFSGYNVCSWTRCSISTWQPEIHKCEIRGNEETLKSLSGHFEFVCERWRVKCEAEAMGIFCAGSILQD